MRVLIGFFAFWNHIKKKKYLVTLWSFSLLSVMNHNSRHSEEKTLGLFSVFWSRACSITSLTFSWDSWKIIKRAFLVRDNRVLNGPLGCSQRSFACTAHTAHTAHTTHLLCSAPLCYTCSIHRLAHSLRSFPHGTVEILEYVAVIAFHRIKRVFHLH